MRINDRVLASSAYFFGVPALFILLTDSRKRAYVGHHGTRAFFLWALFFVAFFAIRFFIDYVWSANFIPGLEVLESVAVVLMGMSAFFLGCRAFARGRARASR